ncbi:MAG TPA: hypothetical protein VNU71_07725 [Burkholderiaceae bacterium]|nr:hypothetical protein [Burkholderiaceae bacterium]
MPPRDPLYEQRSRDSFARRRVNATLEEVARKLIATMTATIMTVTGRDDVRH